MKAALFTMAVVISCSSAHAAGQYFPRYGAENGGMIEFYKSGFYIHATDSDELSVYVCKKIGSMTTAIHWAQCEGGKKFLFTLDPKHPETMKIGDVVYRECGKLWDKC